MSLLRNNVLELCDQVSLKQFCKTELFSLYINYVHQITVFIWHKDVTNQQYRQGILWLNEIVLTNQIKDIIIDASVAGEVARHNYDWTLQTFAKFQGSSFVRKVAQVISPETLALRLTPELEACAASTAYQPEFKREVFDTKAEAVRWVLQERIFNVA